MPTSRCASTAPAASAGRARPSPSGGSCCTTPALPTASGTRPRGSRRSTSSTPWNAAGETSATTSSIDEAGTVYEGRAGTADVFDGGPAVVGGHVHGHNGGTLGIALLGTLIERPPSPRAWRSLVTVMAWLARRHDLDPLGNGGAFPAICAHRDLTPTPCPGEACYELLAALRTQVAAAAAGR